MDIKLSSSVLVTTTKRLLFLALIISFSACNSGGSPSTSGSNSVEKSDDLGTAAKNVPLNAGTPIEIKFTYTIPGDLTSKGDIAINVAKSLQGVTLSSSPVAENPFWDTLKIIAEALVKSAYAQTAETAVITAFISYPGDPNVCSSSEQYGPYSITGMVGAALAGDVDTISPTARTIDIMNQGSVEVCIVTTPPVDAYVTISGVVVDVDSCATPTVEIANTRWSGNYNCVNFGAPNDSGSITLDITQNPDGSYHYTDGDAEYDGHLCGNVFRFNGAGISDGYTESGTLEFSSETQAGKTSTWNSNPRGSAGGDCTDTLSRV